MQIINGLKSITNPLNNNLCVIGNFESLHIGHLNLIKFARKTANEHNLTLTILTFEPHVKAQMKKDYDGKIISFSHKMMKLKALQVDRVLLIRPKDNVFDLNAEDFINEVLLKKVNASIVMVGESFRFARKQEGTIEDLKNRAFKLILFPLLMVENNKYSSAEIKKFIKNGDVKGARKNLGYDYSIIGKVIKGRQLGRTIGFPTINVSLEQLLAPKFGVYVARVCFLDNVHKIYNAVVNIGIKPTVSVNNKPMLEAHILGGFNSLKYGSKVQVTLVKLLRIEKKFNNLEELKEQIAIDCEQANNILHSFPDHINA